ncbi:MAG: HEAT repeat domain-containing protein, partial [Planctomycetia bacterium]
MGRSSRGVGLLAVETRLLRELRDWLACGCARQETIKQLRQLGLSSKAMVVIQGALRDSEPRVREAACLALEYLEEFVVVFDLRPMLHDPDSMVAVRAADALESYGVPAAALIPRLREILSQPEGVFPRGKDRIQPPCKHLQMPNARYHAARILGYLDKEAAPAREELRAALKSCSAIVRSVAAKALAGIGESPEVYLPPLRRALGDVEIQSSRERFWAAEALVELGEPPASVVAVLAELAGDEDWG